MAIEIERKFLVEGDAWRAGVTGARHIRQAYLSPGGAAAVRIRVIDEQKARLTIKAAAAASGVSALCRSEFEYPLPLEDALAMLDLRVGRIVEKTRFHVPAGNGRIWEVDVFAGALDGLVLAEIELGDADEDVMLPAWIGREVTDDPAYSNAVLAQGD